MKSFLATALAASTILSAIPALASPSCDVPDGQRMPLEQVRAKAQEMGYEVRKVEQDDDGCYEAYARNASGERVEIYLDPKSGAVLRVKTDD